MALSTEYRTAVAHRIWLAPAILEQILLQLDPHTLLLCQRTSKIFSTTTRTSISLQKKLFLHPITSPQDILHLNLAAPKDASSTFIIPHRIPQIPPNLTPASQITLINPFFPNAPGWGTDRSFQDLRKRPKFIAKSLCTVLELPHQGLAPRNLRRLQFPAAGERSVTQSWEKMFLSQPPILQAFPRGWHNPIVGGTVAEVCKRVARTRRGEMFIVVVGERVEEEDFWEAMEREEGEFREWVAKLEEAGEAGTRKDYEVRNGAGVQSGIKEEEAGLQDTDTVLQDMKFQNDLFPGKNEMEESSEDENADLWTDDASNYYNPPKPSTHNTSNQQTPQPPPNSHAPPLFVSPLTPEDHKPETEEDIAFQKQCREYYAETMASLEVSHEEVMKMLVEQQIEMEKAMGNGDEMEVEPEMVWD